MSELTHLISRIHTGIEKHSVFIRLIRHPLLLLHSLKELNDVIGNDKVKDAVATQVSHLIMAKRRAVENPKFKEDDSMINTILYGPPGVGKTLIGTKLAQIWYSLGFIESNKKKSGEIGGMLKDLLKENGMNDNNSDSIWLLYLGIVFVMVLIVGLSLTWSFYGKFGGKATVIACAVLLVIILLGIAIIWLLCKDDNANVDIKNNIKNNIKNDIKENNSLNVQQNTLNQLPSDDDIIKIVSREDFVGKYVGWTADKTLKLLENNLGKVLFVDEAYSLINGPHDEFGIEALTTLNLFISQHPREIIVIFAGYEDLLEAGPFSVQPGLRRRFMWQFECSPYTDQELFQIFKLQLHKKGWTIGHEEEVKQIFSNNSQFFTGFGGDTDRVAFFAKLEHSRDYLHHEANMSINMLEPKHISKGIDKLKENNIKSGNKASTNPMANMMRMLAQESELSSVVGRPHAQR